MKKNRWFKKIAAVFLLISLSMTLSCEEGRVLVTEVNHCSKLDFEGIEWPEELSSLGIDTYSLALNITGSYEGYKNWSTLSNNFDGQGVSLGIFQQNLGQGSLQPLLIKVDNNHSRIFSQYFNQYHRASMASMLNAWKDRRRLNSEDLEVRSLASSDEEITFDSLYEFSTPTDIGSGEGLIFTKASNAVNQYSVDWAVDNLFINKNGRTFKSSWKKSLQNLAKDPRYVSLQVGAGYKIHKKAIRYMELYEAKELRSYLFFYDIIVQNGGIDRNTRQDYLDDIAGRELTENERMKILLSHRVLRSKKRWRADVLARKTAILDGFGVVHKRQRNFSEEFCLPLYDKMLIR